MNKIIVPNYHESINKWLCYIEQLHKKTIVLELDRIYSIAKKLDLLKPAPYIFTVAGTNGKGTTCHILENILIAANYRVGVYSSPHLLKYNERVRIQGNELPDHVHTHSFSIIEKYRNHIPLTYFEFSTLSALMLFNQSSLDIVILEVGLGGRLDATNIIDADIAIITNIALDHTNWLGTDRESIGREKAGIFRNNKPAIIGDSNVPLTMIQIANDKKVQLLQRDKQWYFTYEKNSWCFHDNQGSLKNLPLLTVPTANAATALAALRISSLSINENILRYSLPHDNLPGRFQIIERKPHLILDVAHNPHAAHYLKDRLINFKNNRKGKVFSIIGMLNDKDIQGTVTPLLTEIDEWYCITLNIPRGAHATQISKYLSTNANIFEKIEHAWQEINKLSNSNDIILVFGSFYTVAQIMKIIQLFK